MLVTAAVFGENEEDSCELEHVVVVEEALVGGPYRKNERK